MEADKVKNSINNNENKNLDGKNEEDNVVENFDVEYKKDVNGCIQDKSVETKEKTESRFDEISNSLVDEERQMREEEFGKLNLPESEFLRTETSAAHFPENNRPVEPSIKVDKEAINKTLKTSGQEAAKLAKSWYGSIKDTAEKRRDERKQRMIEKREAEKAKLQKSYSSVNEVTHIDEVVEKESNLKTIEELKKPELASYPIVHPKTVEVIQEDQSENTQDYQEAKQIVEPDVKVEKDLPQQEKDPYVSKEDKAPSKFQKSSKWVWLQMKKGYQFIKQSDIAKQVIGVGIGCTILAIGIVKRNSFKTIRSMEQLQSVLKSPCQFHGAVQSIQPGSNTLLIKQIAFPQYLSKTRIAEACLADGSFTIPVSLLSLNACEQQYIEIDNLVKATASSIKKVKVLYYPNEVNETIPNNVVYGDVLLKGFGGNALSRAHYHSLSRYLVRMGICSVDRDINIDINKPTQKFMKQLSNDELYAIRRKLGMWEERSSTFEDNIFMKGWFAMYRPFYSRFVHKHNILNVKTKDETDFLVC